MLQTRMQCVRLAWVARTHHGPVTNGGEPRSSLKSSFVSAAFVAILQIYDDATTRIILEMRIDDAGWPALAKLGRLNHSSRSAEAV